MYNVIKTSRQKGSDNFCQAIRDAVKSDEERRSVILLLLHMPVPRACPTSVYFCLFLYFCLVIVLFSKDHKPFFEEHFSLPKIWPPTPSPNTTHQIIPIPRCSLPHLRFNISPYWALQFSMIMTTFWWYCVKPVHYKYSCRSAKKIRKYECNKKDTFQSKSCVFPYFFK